MSFVKENISVISWISSIIVISLLAVSLGTNHWIRVVDKNTNSITYFGLNNSNSIPLFSNSNYAVVLIAKYLLVVAICLNIFISSIVQWVYTFHKWVALLVFINALIICGAMAAYVDVVQILSGQNQFNYDYSFWMVVAAAVILYINAVCFIYAFNRK